jgi:Uma2 family endonuclease
MGNPELANLPHYTWEDFQHWEGRWELIDGIAYAMSPAPSLRHQSLSSNIAWILKEQLRDCRHCQALLPVDWRISEDTVVQPDNLVICGEVSGQFLTKAPTLIVEILSKSTEHKDKTTKFRLYQQEGVKYYLIVDPETQIVKVYDWMQGRYVKRLDASNEILEFELGKCQISMNMALIW